MRAVFCAGVSAGLPIGLGGAGVAATAFAYRLLWAPLLDRYAPVRRMRRRGWLIATQVLLALLLCAHAFTGSGAAPRDAADPAGRALAAAIAVVGATVLTAADAYRVELLGARELGPGAGLFVVGLQLGLLAGGGWTRALAGRIGWRAAWGAVALLLCGLARVAARSPDPVNAARPPPSFEDAVVWPFRGLIRRETALEVLAFILLYQASNVMAGEVLAPFLHGQGVAVADARPWRLVPGALGALVGGYAIPWVGTYAELWIAGLAHALAMVGYWWLAARGPSPAPALLLVSFDGFTAGLALAGLHAFVTGMCEKPYAATQAAVLFALAGLSRHAALPVSFAVANLGQPLFFLLCASMAAPPLLLLTRCRWWARRGTMPPLT